MRWRVRSAFVVFFATAALDGAVPRWRRTSKRPWFPVSMAGRAGRGALRADGVRRRPAANDLDIWADLAGKPLEFFLETTFYL